MGVRVGQTVADARAVHPSLITHPAEPYEDARALKEIAAWAGRYGPNRNVDGDDGLWIEITGVAHLFGGEALLARDLAKRLEVAGFTVRIGIADTVSAAHALARFAGEPRKPIAFASPGKTESRFASLPVDALRLTDDSVLLLKRLGLRQIGQLTGLPRVVLARRFRDEGRAGRKSDRTALARAVVWRLDQALGRIAEPRAALEEQPLYRHMQSFEEPLISAEAIQFSLENLAAQLADGLRANEQGALQIRFSLYRSDGTRAAINVGASSPTNEASHLSGLFRERLDAIDAGMGVDLVMLEAFRVDRCLPSQSSLTASRRLTVSGAATGAAQLVDRLVNRIGSDRVLRLKHSPSHLPEKAQARTSALNFRSLETAARSDLEAFQDCGRKGPRPPFMLPHPEPITVIAELPEGAPAQFKWRRVSRRVARSSGPERIAPEWWQNLPGLAAVRNEESKSEMSGPLDDEVAGKEVLREGFSGMRDYYVLEDDHGGRYWVFRDGLFDLSAEHGTPGWYMQGLFG